MPVSGLVVSLSDQHALREATIDTILQESRIGVGVIQSQRMAVVVDTPTREEDKEIWNWLNALPGVTFVDVALVGFEDDQ